MLFREVFTYHLNAQSISLNRLARDTGISSGLLSRYARGMVEPGQTNLEKICTALGLTQAQFWAMGSGTDLRKILKDLQDQYGKDTILALQRLAQEFENKEDLVDAIRIMGHLSKTLKGDDK